MSIKLKQRFVPQLPAMNHEFEDFCKMLETVDTSHIKERKVVKGQVIEMKNDIIIADVGIKNVGFHMVCMVKNIESNNPFQNLYLLEGAMVLISQIMRLFSSRQ